MSTPAIVIHGGAWAIPDKLVEASLKGVKLAAQTGYDVIMAGGSAVDAVQAAVTVMENDPVFDAGHGSVLNAAGEVEMDAMIMDGRTMNTGAVAAVKNIANPVQLARLVMDKTEHCLLVAHGANAFAEEMGIHQVAPESLVTDEAREEYEKYVLYKSSVKANFSMRDSTGISHDTVGAVALDKHGNVSCATSTGGITAKRPGRVGDSPIIGSGGYADNESGAVSTTGHGEAILKVCLAHSITNKMHSGQNPQEAAEASLQHMAKRCHGSGGVVVVAKDGQIGKAFTTERMAWASLTENLLQYGINHGEEHSENITN